jgi:hypothetical protein
MNTKFWLLEPQHTDTMVATVGPYERITCAAGHVRARHPKIGELVIELPSHPLSDFEWTSDADIVISEHALGVLERHNVTGFEVRPVAARYDIPVGREPPPRFELVVTGWGGLAARAAGVHLAGACRPCKHRDYTIADPTRIVDPSTWDGSDLFMVWPLPRYRFASDRLAEILRRAPISGVKLLPADRIDVEPGATLGPGPLDTWMPKRRALEIGKHFDVLEG